MRHILLLVMVLLSLAVPAIAQSATPAGELITAGAPYDGTVVTVVGELVGDFGVRTDGTVWAQLNDDSYVDRPLRETGTHDQGNTGIGIRFGAGLGFELEEPGGYRLRGPIVAATGIWHHHDPDRGGESYLEVTSFELVEPARALEDPAFWPLWILGLGLLLAAYYLYWHKNQERVPGA